MSSLQRETDPNLGLGLGFILDVGGRRVRANGLRVLVMFDPVTPHGDHLVATVISTKPNIRVNGFGVVRSLDIDTCLHPRVPIQFNIRAT